MKRRSHPTPPAGRRWPVPALGLAAGLALAASACGSGATSAGPPTSAAATAPAGSATTNGGPAASAAPGGSPSTSAPAGTGSARAGLPVLAPGTFQGQATTIDGQPFDLGSLANQDLVVWFWAPW